MNIYQSANGKKINRITYVLPIRRSERSRVWPSMTPIVLWKTDRSQKMIDSSNYPFGIKVKKESRKS